MVFTVFSPFRPSFLLRGQNPWFLSKMSFVTITQQTDLLLDQMKDLTVESLYLFHTNENLTPRKIQEFNKE